MDIELSEDQQLFRETTARFIEARSPMATVRALADDPKLRDADVVRAAGELGWFALFIPEEFGGGSISGAPLRDAAIVAEERGRTVQPGPFVATNVVALAVVEAGRPEQQKAWLPGLASGEKIGAWAISDGSGIPAAGALRIRATTTGLELSGTAGLVAEGGAADLFLVTAVGDSGDAVQCVVPADASGIEITRLTSLDLTRQFVAVSFTGVRLPDDALLGDGDSTPLLERLIDVAVTLTVAESVGAMSRLIELTVAYAKDRTAFGRPIGSFQALKHLLADASFSAEVSAAGATATADAVSDRSPAASEIASITKAFVGDAGVSVAQACQQVHGGIGFTWEHDLHFYLRRLAVDRVLYGDPSWHRDEFAGSMGSDIRTDAMTTTMPADLAEYRSEARAWIAANLIPRTARQDPVAANLRGSHEYTREQIAGERPKQRALFEAGYAGITLPVEYGGQGLSRAHERAFLEEAADYELPDFGYAGSMTFGVCAAVMLAHASEEFKQRHLPRMLKGEELWVQFFSEPSGGSDLAGVRTRATRDGDSWILNGAKVWTSFGHLADWGLCLARTNGSVPKHRGLTWFGVPVDANGVTVRVIRLINGGADFCEEFFDDVVIPDAERIGDIDQGWTVAQTMLVHERGGSTEVSDAPLEPGPLAPDLVALARTVGRIDDPQAHQLIARAHSLMFLREALSRRVRLTLRHRGASPGFAAYWALAHGTFDAERANIGLDLAGGQLAAWDPSDVDGVQGSTALAFLNGKINSVAGGTDQMQRNAISEQVLGLPREPSFDRDKPFDQVLRDAEHWDGRIIGPGGSGQS